MVTSPRVGKATTFASFQDVRKCEGRRQWLIKWVKWTSVRCLRHSFEISSFPQVIFNFNEFINLCKTRGQILSGGSLSSASSRAWTLALTHLSWFSSHRSCGVNCFSKQSAIALALSTGWYFRPKRPWMAVGALGPSVSVRDLAMGHVA
jgi:hypothetical protein